MKYIMQLITASGTRVDIPAEGADEPKGETVQILLWNSAFIAYGVIFYFLLVRFFG
jgi:hypothetical protein